MFMTIEVFWTYEVSLQWHLINISFFDIARVQDGKTMHRAVSDVHNERKEKGHGHGNEEQGD